MFTRLVAVACLLSPLTVLAVPEEVIPLDENTKNLRLVGGMKAGLKKQRDVHTKTHGCFDGARVKILPNLPKELAIGLFAGGGKEYDAMVRLSNGAGEADIDDNKGGGQGFALKVFLPEDLQRRVFQTDLEKWYEQRKYYLTQDFLGINRVPEFFVENVDDYMAFFGVREIVKQKILALKKDLEEKKITQAQFDEQLPKIQPTTFDQVFIHPKGQPHRERQAAVGARIGKILTLDPLAEEYFSMVPSRLGDQAVKYRMRPCEFGDPNAVKLPKHIDPKTNKNYVRAMGQYRLSSGDLCYKLAVQIHKEGMPSIEHPSDAWSTDISDYVDVAEITAKQKEVGKELVNEELCETLSFTPWHALPEHLPVGAVQRTRLPVYAVIANTRNENAGRRQVAKTLPGISGE